MSKLGLAVALAVGLSGFGCGFCTAAGCEDTLALEIQSPDGGLVERFRGELTLDGQTNGFECPTPQGSANYSCFSVGIVQISLSSFGRTGMSRVIGANLPATLPLTVEAADGGLAWSGSLTPAYKEFRPNGPTCGPICLSTRHVVSLQPR